jgi:aspartyl protease family protein
MGHVYVDAQVTAQRAQTVRFLVDTGASYSLLPRAVADALGVVTLPTPLRVSLANGKPELYPVGTVLIELAGRQGAMTTLVGPDGPDVEPLLGVEALEGLGLAVDPTSGTLTPTRPRAALLVGVRPPP